MYHERTASEAIIKSIRDGHVTYYATPNWVYRKTSRLNPKTDIVSKRAVTSIRLGTKRNHLWVALALLCLPAFIILPRLGYPFMLIAFFAGLFGLLERSHYAEIEFYDPSSAHRRTSWAIVGREEDLLEFVQVLRG